MPRVNKPFEYRGWFRSKIGGVLTKLVPIEQGKRAAKDMLDRLLAERKLAEDHARRHGLVFTDKPLTVKDLATRLMIHVEANRSTRTARWYESYLRPLVDRFGDRPAVGVSLTDGNKYKTDLVNRGYGPVSVNHHIRAAEAVFNHAIEEDLLAKNPWRKVEALTEEGRRRVVTEAEFDKLLEACGTDAVGRPLAEKFADNARDILQLLRFTAMRPGEVLKLRWQWVQADEFFIEIPAGHHKTGRTTKVPKPRMVLVLEDGLAILARRRAEIGESSPYVFPTLKGGTEGRQRNVQAVGKWFRRLCRRAGVDDRDANGERLVPYSLRHTRLTEMAMKEGMNPWELKEIAGHTSLRMGERYIHTTREDIVRAGRRGAAQRKATARDGPPSTAG